MAIGEKHLVHIRHSVPPVEVTFRESSNLEEVQLSGRDFLLTTTRTNIGGPFIRLLDPTDREVLGFHLGWLHNRGSDYGKVENEHKGQASNLNIPDTNAPIKIWVTRR